MRRLTKDRTQHGRQLLNNKTPGMNEPTPTYPSRTGSQNGKRMLIHPFAFYFGGRVRLGPNSTRAIDVPAEPRKHMP